MIGDIKTDAEKGRIAVTRLAHSVIRANQASDTGDVLRIAQMVAEKRLAMQTVTCDGTGMSRFSPSLRTICTTLPTTTAQDLRRSGAMPLSEEEQIRMNNLDRYRASVEYLQQLLQGPTLTLQQIAGDRTRIAYRLIRLMAQIKGDVKPGELLLKQLSNYENLTTKWEFPLPYRPGRGTFRGVRHVIKILLELNNAHTTYTFEQGPSAPATYTWGTSYLPVPVPDDIFPDQDPKMIAQARRLEQIPADYDEYEDYGLIGQLYMYEQCASHLNIGKDDPMEMAALSALLNPKIARLAWPTVDEMEAFEETVLLPWVYHWMTRYSYEKMQSFLQEQLKVTYLEAMDLLETAKYFVSKVARFSKDIERGVMFSKVDRLMDDCQLSGMVSTELNAMKLKMQAVGLTTPGEDLYQDRQMALSSGLRDKIKKHEVKKVENKEIS